MLKAALIGRPNVGKSTLFNRFMKTRQAVVSPLPGLTRDRHYGVVEVEDKAFILVDTGGLGGEGELDAQIVEQAKYAVDECDLICFVVSAGDGLSTVDEALVLELRRSNKPLWLVVNKTDKQNQSLRDTEFASLGIAPCFYTAAVSNHGVPALRQKVLEAIGQKLPREQKEHIQVAFIGRPNAGKSTLINKLVKQDRLITSASPGTTRDSIRVPFSIVGRKFILIDTAGVRRKSKLQEDVEKFSVIRSLESIVLSDAVVLVCDATDGITDQDAHLASQVIEQSLPLIIAVNKSDLIDAETDNQLQRTLDKRLRFIEYVEKQYISALLGKNIKALMRQVVRVYDQSMSCISTSECNRVLQEALQHHTPPLISGRPIVLHYMCQVGVKPPSFAIYGKRVDKISDSYKRYLMSYFRKRFLFESIPVRVEFRTSQ